MDINIAEWESVANSVLSGSNLEARRKAEEKIQQLRVCPQPYDICCSILSCSANDFLLYEAGRCLSQAVVKEWDTVFAPSFHEGDQSKAKQLLSFILQWSEGRGTQVSAAPRQRVLSVAGTIIKRAASSVAAQITNESAASTDSSSASTTTTRAKLDAICQRLADPSSDPSLASCHLVTTLVDHVESLIRPFLMDGDVHQISPQEKELSTNRCLLGMCILSAVLDDWSFSDDNTQAELSLETHRILETRFQNHELLRIFCLLLRLADRVVTLWTNVNSLNAVENDLLFRLVSCLDSVFSWNFVPISGSGLRMFRRRDRSSKTCFHPSLKWSVVLGPDSLPTTLLVLIKLHMLVRNSSMLGSRTAYFFVRLTSIAGPLVELSTQFGTQSTESTTPELLPRKPSTITSHVYLLICTTYLTDWLTDNSDESLFTSSFLVSLEPDLQQLVAAELTKLLCIPVAAQLPRLPTSQLFSYELPLLADVFEQIAFRKAVIADQLGIAREAPVLRDGSQHLQLVCLPALMILVMLDRFFARLAALLIQCFHFAVKLLLDRDDSESPINEAIERLSCSWLHLMQFTSLGGLTNDADYTGDHSALPLTARGMEQQELQTHQMRELFYRFSSNVSQYRTHIFQSYLVCKLAPPDGMRPGSVDEDVIDLELDTEDVFSCENSLYACASCGLASATQAATTLVHLLNDRSNRMIQTQHQPISPQSLDVFEDVHWILLITGHFLVTGPSSLESVSRCWSSEFSVPPELLGGPVDHDACSQLLQLVATRCPNPQDPWPPAGLNLSSVPAVIQLFTSLYRLLWFQCELHVGSAQLLEDNLWLMSRFALAYLCQSVRFTESSVDDHTTSPLLAIFHLDSGTPTPAHQTRSHSASTSPEYSEAGRVCLQGLLSCAYLSLTEWSAEPKVVSSAIGLIRILARHTPNAPLYISCPAWYKLCSLLCNSESTGPGHKLSPDSLMELVEACLCGSWSPDMDRMSLPDANACSTESPSDPLVLQLFHSFRQKLSTVFARFSGPRNTAIASSDVDALVRSVATIRGLVRFSGFAIAFNSAVDLVSFIWTSLLAPALETSVTSLITNYYDIPEITQCVLNLFAEVGESCFVYLANIPLGTGIPNSQPSGNELTEEYHLVETTASSVFLNLVLKLYRNYGKRSTDVCHSNPLSEDDHVNHISTLLSMLDRLASNEFELRWTEDVPNGATTRAYHDRSADSRTIRSVDVIAVCLGHMLLTISESLLMIPELCNLFYSTLSSACELHIESLGLLDDTQLVYLGRLLRLGVFGQAATVPIPSNGPYRAVGASADSSIVSRCLDALKMIADHCLDIRSKSTMTTGCSGTNAPAALEVARRLSLAIGLDAQLLADLFGLLLKDSYSLDVELPLSLIILCLIHMNPDSYAQLVSQWLSSTQDCTTRNRLQLAFEHLGCPADKEGRDQMPPAARLIACFTNQKPTVTGRVDFQRRFHQFAAEVRAFACRV